MNWQGPFELFVPIGTAPPPAGRALAFLAARQPAPAKAPDVGAKKGKRRRRGRKA